MSGDLRLRSPDRTIGPDGDVDFVLLVEDDDDLRSALADTLTRQGFLVIEAADGEVALKIMRNMGAMLDWLITDIHIGLISGLHVAFEFRFLHPTRPIAFMSGHELPVEISRMNDVVALRKPFASRELLRVMSALRSSKHTAVAARA